MSGSTTPPPAPAYTLQILHQSDLEASLPALGRMAQSAAIVDRLEDDYANTIKIINGDAWLPGPFYAAEGDASVTAALRAFYGNTTQGGGSTRVSVAYMNAIGTNVASFGNHEFDAGTAQIADGIRPSSTNAGARFPYLSANYEFGNDPNLRAAVTADAQEASSIPGRIAGSAVVTLGGERVGVVGVTTQILASISSPGLVTGKTPNADDVRALAAVTQPYIDALRAQGINKIVVSSHLQQYQLESALVPLLSGVDVIISGGSHTLFTDSNDVIRPGDAPVQSYPLLLADRDGNPVLQVQTQNEYSYVGRLVVGFDAAGNILPGSVDPNVSGNFVTTDASVAALYAGADPYAAGSKGAQVRGLAQAVSGVVNAKDGNVQGFTNVFLNGNRLDVRNQETNLGDVSADANLLVARAVDPTVLVSIKNSGGIRDVIGSFSTDAASRPIPPAANPGANKPSGGVSQLDIENSLRFNNNLSLVTVSAQNFARLIEHGVAAFAPGTTPGQFPQVGGISFSFDPSRQAQVTNTAGVVTTPGQRVRNLAIVNDDGSVRDLIVQDGVLVGDPNRAIRTVTLDFQANGGDGYRFDVYGSNRIDLLNNAALPDGAATFAAKGTEQDAFAEYLRAVAPTAATALSTADGGPASDQRIQNLASRADSVLLGQVPAAVAASLNASAAVTGPVNVVSAADVAGLAAPIAGRTNIAQLAAAAGSVNALPAGFQGGSLAGPNAASLTSSVAGAVLIGNAGASSLTTTGATSTLIAGTGNTSLLATGGGNLLVGNAGGDSIAGGGTIFTGAGANLVATNAAGAVVRAEGRDTVFTGLAGAGNDTIGAAPGSLGTVVFAGPGSLTFVNDAAPSTVTGGAGGSATVFGGAGGGIFQGGTAGNNVLIGQSGAVTLFGGGSGDLLYAGGPGQNILVAGAGNETLQGGAGAGGSVFVGGFGTANTTVGGGAGDDIIFAGTGGLVADGGAGVDLFVFDSSRPGGTAVINGFSTAQDRLALLGYAAGEAGRALGAAQVAGGSTTLTLADNTRITFTGVSDLSSSAFV